MTTLLTWLKPPEFEDREKDRAARVLYLIMLIVSGLLILYLFSTFLIAKPDNKLGHPIFLLMPIFLVIGILLMVRAGYVYAAGQLFVGFGWLVLTFGVAFFGGVRGPSYSAFILLIINSSLILGVRGTVGTAVVSCLTGWVVLNLEVQGVIAIDETLFSLEEMFAAVTPYFLTAGVLVAFYHHSFMKLIVRAKENERSLLASNEALQQLQHSLEAQVVERTQDVERMRQEAEAARQIVEGEMWLATGLSQVSTAIRGEQGLNSLSGLIIQQVCLYMEAPIGRLFIWHDEKLIVAGGYAYVWAEEQAPQFALGEGYVGQAAQQMALITIDAVDATYLSITSAVGTNCVERLLLQPLWYEGALWGVIEIGDWHTFTQLQRLFLKRLAPLLSATLYTVQTRLQVDLWSGQEGASINQRYLFTEVK